MSADYLEQLGPGSLALLAETTGMATRADAGRFFASRPNGIRVALSSPEAAGLLAVAASDEADTSARRILQIAIAIHHTAQEICSAGWTARDDSPVDIPLLRFAGQGPFQNFMVDLLASYLPTDPMFRDFGAAHDHADLDQVGFDHTGLGHGITPDRASARFFELVWLCADVAETERAGALRLLGDEALFSASICPAIAASVEISPAMLDQLQAVLPRAVRSLFEDLAPQLRTLLDIYLMFGPVWYRMASQNLLYRSMRVLLGDMATEFGNARRFLVQVAQGPLAVMRADLFALAG